MIRTVKRLSLLLGGLAFGALAIGAFAQAAPVYYVSMRGITTESGPSYLEVLPAADATHAAALTGCDGHTYYATASDAATIAAARAGGEVVQLHKGVAGQPVTASKILCIIDFGEI